MAPYSSLLYDAATGKAGTGIIVLTRNYFVSKLVVVKRDYVGPGAKDLVVCDVVIYLLVVEGLSKVLILFVDVLTSLLVDYCCIDAAFCLFGRGGTCPALLLAPLGALFPFAA